MTNYAIGDIQGCCDALDRLLDKISFNPASDKLWVAGDIVNRGPASLRSLRTIKSLGNSAVTVLGNHDLHLLSVAYGLRKPSAKDTLDDILNADDRDELLHWVRHQPLLHYDGQLRYVMTHAGLHPHWDLATAQTLAKEVENALQGEHHVEFVQSVYSNKPARWKPDLSKIDRLRFAVNCFTRMRYCKTSGKLDFDFKGPPEKAPDGLVPWYRVDDRIDIIDESGIKSPLDILFGHWASHGKSTEPHIHALDFGCVWGGELVAMTLESKELTRVNCSH